VSVHELYVQVINQINHLPSETDARESAVLCCFMRRKMTMMIMMIMLMVIMTNRPTNDTAANDGVHHRVWLNT